MACSCLAVLNFFWGVRKKYNIQTLTSSCREASCLNRASEGGCNAPRKLSGPSGKAWSTCPLAAPAPPRVALSSELALLLHITELLGLRSSQDCPSSDEVPSITSLRPSTNCAIRPDNQHAYSQNFQNSRKNRCGVGWGLRSLVCKRFGLSPGYPPPLLASAMRPVLPLAVPLGRQGGPQRQPLGSFAAERGPASPPSLTSLYMPMGQACQAVGPSSPCQRPSGGFGLCGKDWWPAWWPARRPASSWQDVTGQLTAAVTLRPSQRCSSSSTVFIHRNGPAAWPVQGLMGEPHDWCRPRLYR